VIHLSSIDITIIFLYFGAVLFVGFRAARKGNQSSEEDFLLAGRSLTLPIFIMTLVSTWYGGILGVGEFSYRYGISNWVVQGVPYYIFAAVFALFLAKKIRATNLTSIADKLQASYDTKTAVLGAALTFILMTPAPYILMLSVFLQLLFGWNMMTCILVTTIVAASYLYVGGFRSDVETDVLEFFLMFAGFAVIIPFCFMKYGGFEFLTSHLPPLHLTWHGGNSAQYILVWFFIALWTLVDPAFHQRCYAAKDGTVAQRGILLSIIFWCVFDFMTATAGLYARAAIPHLDQPMMAYPMLAEAILPPIAKGLFYVGMLATIMSTLNTLVFVSAQTLGRDMMLRISIRNSGSEANLFSANNSTSYTQLGFIISLLLSIVLAVTMPSVIQMWYTIGTIVIPGLLIPLMASYFESLKIPARYAFLAMLTGWLTSLGWLIAGNTNSVGGGLYPFGIEPMYPGLVVALVLWGVGRIKRN
jgi:SSS family solute:Na+ symporter